MTEKTPLLSLTIDYPTYNQVQAFIQTMAGIRSTDFRSMMSKIFGQAGTPQKQVQWANPEEWIPERLDGGEKELALRIWRDTKGLVNPRHTDGCSRFCKKHDLLAENKAGILEKTQAAEEFLNQPQGPVTIAIDRSEGIFVILNILRNYKLATRADILPEFVDFCDRYTHTHGRSNQIGFLGDRIKHLVQRGFIRQDGFNYQVTTAGLHYLSVYGELG